MPVEVMIGLIVAAVCILIAVIAIIVRVRVKRNKHKVKIDDSFINNLMSILGGKENISSVEVDNARLKFQLHNVKSPNYEELKKIATQGVFITGNFVKVLFKFDSNLIKKEIEGRL